MAACFFVLVLRASATKNDNCRKSAHGRNFNISDSSALIDVTTDLGWKTIAVVHDYSEGSQLLQHFLQSLYQRGIPAMLFHQEVASFTATGCVPRDVDGVLALGSFGFVETVFRQVAICATENRIESILYLTKWLTVLDDQDARLFEDAARPFENVAVIKHKGTGGVSLWTMRHVQDDSQLSLVSTLPPPAPPLTRHHILPNPSHGLGGRTLRVVIKEFSYHIINKTKNGVERYEGVMMDILLELSNRLNFTFTLLNPPDDSWGQELDNGSWDGPIGMLTRKEADLAVSLFTLTRERSVVADPTSAVIYDNAVIIFKTASRSLDDWSFLQPFQTPVYVAIISCFVSVLVLLLLLEKCQWTLGDHQDEPTGVVAILQWIAMDFEILLAGVLNRPITELSESRAGRVLVCAWLLLGVVIASVYSSKLTSSLMMGEQALPFTSMAQLLGRGDYTWGVNSGTAQELLLKTSGNKEYQEFYRGVLRFAQSDPGVTSSDYSVHKRKVIEGQYAYFSGTGELYRAWSAESCGVTMIPEVYMTAAMGFYLQKGSPYTTMISAEIGRMRDVGLIDYWRRKWQPAQKQCDPDVVQSSRVIALTDTQTAFYLAGVGVGLAAFVLVIECLTGFILKTRACTMQQGDAMFESI